jgi:hypothetical protein
MKTKFLIIIIAFTTFGKAQIVNIPNANFKAKLLSANSTNTIAKDLSGNFIDIDTNNDNEIQESEALQVKELNLLNCNNVSSIVGINSFINLTKLEFSNASYSTVGLTSSDLTNLNLLNYLDIICGTLNLGDKNFIETLYIPNTTNLTFNSNTATIKFFKGKLSAFTSINYLKRLSVEEITFTFLNYPDAKVPYEVLKYHTNLKKLILLKESSDINNEFGNLDFTTYNTLDNPLYPQNIKKLVVQNLTQFFPLQNFANLEDLTFYSVGISDCANCLIFNPNNFLNIKYLTFFRKNSNPISNLNLSVLSNLKIFRTDSYINPMAQETLSTVNFGNNNNLEEIYIYANPFSLIDLTQTPNIKKIDFKTVYNDANGSGTVSPTNITINLAQNNLLENFKTRCYTRTFNNTTVANLTINNLQQSTHLKELFFTATNFVNPIIINSSEFVTFQAPFQTYYNSLTFNTPNLNQFELLTFNNETLEPAIVNDLSLDFSNVTNPNFTIIGDLDYPKLRFVSIKNGLINQQSIEINNDNQGLTFCVDAIEQIPSNYPNGWFWWDLPQNTTITNNCSLGLQENDFIADIFAYPNPVKNFLNFKTEQNILKVEIYDIAGRILSSNSISENKIDLSELKTGNYILKLFTEKGIMNTKIIKE